MQIDIKMITSIILFIAFMIVGRSVILDAARNIVKGRIFDEKFLMSIASIGALCLGEVAEAFGIMLFYQIGELISDKASDKGDKVIEDLCKMKVEKARVLKNINKDTKITENNTDTTDKKLNDSVDLNNINDLVDLVDLNEVKIGDIVQVLPGERIPCDGIIIEGKSFVDNSALTGESVPVEVSAGVEVFSGSVNQDGLILVKVTKLAKESSAAKIIDLMKHSQEKKSKSERFITKFAKVYTPIVVILAVLVAIVPPVVIKSGILEYFIKQFSVSNATNILNTPELNRSFNILFPIWVHRALMLLVVSCPCALVISIPLAFVGGLTSCAKNGILVKSSKTLETLSKVKTALFDKTGTLTRGTFSVQDIHINDFCNQRQNSQMNNTERQDKSNLIKDIKNPINKECILALATHAQKYSNHPIAKSLKMCHKCNKCLTVVLKDTIEAAGFGVHTLIDGDTVIVGNEKLMARHGIKIQKCNQNDSGTIIHVSLNGEYLGHIIINDEIRTEGSDTMIALKKLGVKRLAMLTGDKNEIAANVAKNLGLSEYYAELLPGDKVAIAQKLRDDAHKKHSSLIFTGDGINDAPVIALSDAGIAMGVMGRDAAIDASDVVIMSDNLRLIPGAIKTSKYTMGIVWQNVIVSIAIKVTIMILSAAGLGNMWLAVAGDAGVSILAVLNALRTIVYKGVKIK